MTLSLKTKIFFIGVGNMGNPMAMNLIKAGYDVRVFDQDSSKARNLLSSGGVWADSLAAGASWADLVMASLPGPPTSQKCHVGRIRCSRSHQTPREHY